MDVSLVKNAYCHAISWLTSSALGTSLPLAGEKKKMEKDADILGKYRAISNKLKK